MKVLLVPNDMPATQEAAQLLAARLVCAGIETEVQPPEAPAPVVAPEQLALIVPIGGDGTFLKAVHLVDFVPVPVLGLNHGTLGFLCGNPQRDEVELIADALAGDLHIERRATLDATIECTDGTSFEITALNELAYTRGASGHVVELTYSVNGTHIAKLVADGLVVATATGSTAYALSVGGPIMSPAYAGLEVVPIAPHALNTRALALAPSDVLEITFGGRHMQETSLFVDGNSLTCAPAAHAVVRRGESEVLIANGGSDFFTSVSRVFFGG